MNKIKVINSKNNPTGFNIHWLFVFILLPMIPNLLQAQTSLNDSLRIENIISNLHNKNLRGQIITVENPSDVAFISSFIEKTATQPLQRERTYVINDRKTVGGRYKQGDKSVMPEVLKILDSGDNEAIAELLTQMSQEFDDTLRPYILDDLLKSKIFALITNPELESSIIYFLARQKIDGREKLFEDRLISGKSAEASLLTEKLTQGSFISDKTIDYIYNVNKKNPQKVAFLSNMYSILKGSSIPNRKKILDILYTYLDNYPLTAKDFKSTGINDKCQIAGNLVRFGDQRNLIVQKKMQDLMAKYPELRNDNSFLFTFNNLTGRIGNLQTKKSRLLNQIKNGEALFYNDFFSDEELKKDPELQMLVLQNLVRENYFEENYSIHDIKSDFAYLDSKVFSEMVQKSLISDELKNMFLTDNYVLAKKTKWLSDNGFKTKTLTSQQKADFLKDIIVYDKSNIFTAMAINDIGVNLRPEHIQQTENYNVLIEKFFHLSGGKISNVKSCIQFIYDDYYKKSGPRVFVSYKNKCYILIPEQYTQFSEIGLLRLLVDAIAKDAAITEQYYFLDLSENSGVYGDYCLFGESESIEKLIAEFNLVISRDPQQDYNK
jgi:hypothetical protein